MVYTHLLLGDKESAFILRLKVISKKLRSFKIPLDVTKGLTTSCDCLCEENLNIFILMLWLRLNHLWSFILYNLSRLQILYSYYLWCFRATIIMMMTDNLCFVPTRQCKCMVLHETGRTSNIDKIGKIVKSKNRCPVCQMEA